MKKISFLVFLLVSFILLVLIPKSEFDIQYLDSDNVLQNEHFENVESYKSFADS